MAFAAAITSFLLATAWCARRLRVSSRVVDIPIGVTWLLASWAATLTVRQMTPGSALVSFLAADVAMLLLPILATFRLLGGFDEDPFAGSSGEAGDDDGGTRVAPGDPTDPRQPAAPTGPGGVTPRPVRPSNRPPVRAPRRIPATRRRPARPTPTRR